MGDVFAKLTFDEEFIDKRQQQKTRPPKLGQKLGGFARVSCQYFCICMYIGGPIQGLGTSLLCKLLFTHFCFVLTCRICLRESQVLLLSQSKVVNSCLMCISLDTSLCFQLGLQKEGAVGLLKGTGKGLVGLLVRPTGGLVDLASGTLSFVSRYHSLAIHVCD